MAEKNFQSTGARLLTIEGEVGKPPDLKPIATLWKGTEFLDTTLGILNSYVRVQLIEEIECVPKKLAKSQQGKHGSPKLQWNNSSPQSI